MLRWILIAVALSVATPVDLVAADTPPVVRLRKGKAPSAAVSKKKTAQASKSKRARKQPATKRSAKQSTKKKSKRETREVLRPMP